MPTIEEVTKKYLELRDRKAEIAKRQQEELAPLNEAMTAIETFIMAQMNALGVDSFKTQYGTPYKSTSNSVKLVDARAFKSEVFSPAVQAICYYLGATGYALQNVDIATSESCLQEKARWDMVDFRAGKKGILECVENTGALPAGVSLDSVSVVNIRKS